MKFPTSQLAEQVRYLKDVIKLSFRQIAIEIGIHRVKCSKLYAGKSSTPAARKKLLEPHRALIAAWYREHPSLKAIQILERLQQRQVRVGYSAVKDFTREFRKPKPVFYHTLEFEPGEESQVDWFFLSHPTLGRLAGFALILSYSRYFFARFFQRYSFEFFIEGHLRAFEALGGHTRALRYDNLKSVVLGQKPVRFNPAFLEFAQHYKFEIRLCNVRRANEKGRVERAIRAVRETFCNTAAEYQTLEALNDALLAWCDRKNNTLHRTTRKPPAELKAQEELRPLPSHPWRNCQVLPAQQSTSTGLITFDTNRYSIPEYLVSQPLTVHAFCDRIEIYDVQGSCVATHPRCFARHQKPLINPAHRSFTRISSQAKRDRIHAVIKNLDPIVAQFLLLNEGAGEDPFASAHALFILLKSHARATILSAIREAVTRRRPRMKFIASLLAIQPEDDLPEVLPQRQELLQLNYKPRSLEEYEE